MNFVVLDRILRSPGEVAVDLRADRGSRDVALASLVAVGVGGLIFGGVIGTFHGGAQIVFAAVKMPLALLSALVVATPAFFTFAAICGRYWRARTLFALALSAGARAALVLLATAPVLCLLISLRASYEIVTLAAVMAYLFAGLSALLALLKGLGREKGRVLAVAGFAAVFLLAGAQSAWLLRPYLCSPADSKPLEFVRHEKGAGVVQAVRRSAERTVRGTPRAESL